MMLYLDAKTLSWMFPGFGVTIPGSLNGDSYIMTDAYPELGYVIVMDATTAPPGQPVQTRRRSAAARLRSIPAPPTAPSAKYRIPGQRVDGCKAFKLPVD
jgi:hypothetical protein